MALAVSNPNNVKVYRVGGSARNVTLPEWLTERSKSALKKDPEWRNRIELIQDFEFPEASYRIKLTRDGKYAMATGVYKPQIRVYEFAEMAMKFDRHSDVENINFVILSDDWTKSVHLQADRSLQFHTQFGIHYTTRIPKFGRDLQYHYPSCDLLVGGASSDIYRLNLEEGRFLNPLVTDSPGINKIEINPANQLWCFGGDDGCVEFWDPRIRSRIARIDVQPALREYLDSPSSRPEISALSFRNDGLHLGVGTSSGHVLLYDLRHPAPRLVKDHQYGLEIRNVAWHDRSENVISTDRKIIRMWNRESGALFTSIEPPNDINDVCVVPDSGLLFVAGEAVQMHTYLVPDLGPAPHFAAFLENLTEEMAETQAAVLYDNYKFVTRKELKKLGLEQVVGTAAAKAYMHGYFIDQRLYERAKLIANPFAFEEYKQQLIKEKLEAKRGSRIAAKPKAKVNSNLAAKLGGTDAVDDRFKAVFENPEFAIDESSDAFKLLNPSTKPTVARKNAIYESSDEEDLRKATGAESADEVSDASDDSISDDDAMDVDEPSPSSSAPAKGKGKRGDGTADPILAPRASRAAKSRKSAEPAPPKGPSMVEVKSLESLRRKQTFAARVQAETGEHVANTRSTSGGMEMSFALGGKKGRGGGRGGSSSGSGRGGARGGARGGRRRA
ncbi:hypothetical protein AMAG_06075 [Allomyces macrogynus ATCC 38327]|uniref:Uncharacterized protein n=1 Tax=Allomyces macrogynus (strain ATCC 38327) TaxID=578462 RepID=A0A0L0SE51_ALLM3|nr:hypothetical protein AMAG_06075 [Allomyces macrogynus ATCC 38327]|eukprot:KNE60712.1 hypothetical protein AMAG_06075 [Allomyces macrogynus ATCC 38327]